MYAYTNEGKQNGGSLTVSGSPGPQLAGQPGHGQDGVRLDDHEGREHPGHRGPDQHHPRGAGAAGLPAHRQDRYWEHWEHWSGAGPSGTGRGLGPSYSAGGLQVVCGTGGLRPRSVV